MPSGKSSDIGQLIKTYLTQCTILACSLCKIPFFKKDVQLKDCPTCDKPLHTLVFCERCEKLVTSEQYKSTCAKEQHYRLGKYDVETRKHNVKELIKNYFPETEAPVNQRRTFSPMLTTVPIAPPQPQIEQHRSLQTPPPLPISAAPISEATINNMAPIAQGAVILSAPARHCPFPGKRMPTVTDPLCPTDDELTEAMLAVQTELEQPPTKKLCSFEETFTKFTKHFEQFISAEGRDEEPFALKIIYSSKDRHLELSER